MNSVSYAAGSEEAQGQVWDVVVIGTGAGGATAGFALARAGRSVLFLERGKLLHHDDSVVRGRPFTGGNEVEEALRHGWWPHPVRRQAGDQTLETHAPPFVGCGTGGTTTVFAMLMDRFRPQDFTPRRFQPRAVSTSLPEAWPVAYEELAPFYEEAEKLYRVHGTEDSLAPSGGALREPPGASEKELVISSALTHEGLHPYRMHSAKDHKPECRGCRAMLCPRDCRNDAGKICLRPALEEHGAHIVPECRVVRLEEEGRAVRRAICDRNGQRIVVRGKVFVLAANAFFTPALLERSANERFPEGLANSSGWVGRNLMLHASDFLQLRLKRAPYTLGSGMRHGLSLNDFYVRDGTKLGSVHAHPTSFTRETVVEYMRLHLKWAKRVPEAGLHALAVIGSYKHRSSAVFATILEDLPYLQNRVRATPGSDELVTYEYEYPEELRARSLMLVDAFTSAVGRQFEVTRLRPIGMLNYSHPCGTCRFGDDPRSSVLDRDNRAHDLDNLYVVDGSFFPSSGGINPSLTIVANSLRVSEKIAARV